MIHTKQKNKDKLEISIQKKQQLEKFRFAGTMNPKPNQRVFRLDLYKGILSECDYFYKTDTVNFLDIVNNTIPNNKAILIEEGFDYEIALNIENARKKVSKKYQDIEIVIESNSKSL